ncbi:hypothetical protein [Streptomyces sp. NBC_01477]|uniref:hypothetical protein n=1 Tax=Streptomyces sp. NBC_01477 TaxID=2976015 RepID=UPI002E36A249|nr:hypothetical protein [Streptomyces sp. NBC_01477]
MPPPAQQPYPPAQPYGTPSPYAKPGYQAPPGYPTPQAWGPPVPGGPEGGPPRGGRSKATVWVAIGAALAVIAAVVVTVVFVSGGKKNSDAHDTTTPPVTATSPTVAPTPTPTGTLEPGASGGGGDDPRGPAGSTDVTPVVPGWQAVKRQERNSVFDVPPDWTLDSETMDVGYGDETGKPQVAVGAPAYYKKDICTDGKNTVSSATAGTKGGGGAPSLKTAAENEARAWAKWAFQEKGKGTVSAAQNSKAFHNAHGITGWQAQATITGVPKANKCSSNGIAYTVAWLDPAQPDKPTPVVWVLWARQGVPDQISQAMVDQIMSTIRPMKQ